MFRQEYIKTNTYVGCLKVTLKMDSFVLFILEFFFSQNVHHTGKTVFGHFFVSASEFTEEGVWYSLI